MHGKTILAWAARIAIAAIVGQTLFFKFSGQPESIYIFQTLGVESWGRYLTGTLEAIAVVLLLIPFTTFLGALLTAFLMGGAAASHLFILGISVREDGGYLFFLSITVLVLSIVLFVLTKPENLIRRSGVAIGRIVDALIGNAKFNSLEHRLFNSISLLNGVTNILGSFNTFSTYDFNIFLLNISTGIVFLFMYYMSRIRRVYYALYWPFVLLIMGFLFVNSLWNYGSLGGNHYYFIPALVIATILSRNILSTIAAFLFFSAASASIFLIEIFRPDWIVGQLDMKARILDVSGQFIFVQIFTSILVLVLKNQFNQERNKSEKLLLNILPESIADELKKFDHVEPKYYDSATVLFTDFVGFTKIAESMKPAELIASLDDCFSHFDAIIRKHGLEKIKTIGDAYMAVSGIPIPVEDHALRAVRAALEVQTFMESKRREKAKENLPFWELRLGMNSGHLVAGVVGTQKFVYDVWGDTVNTGSRLESAGSPGRVNISESVFHLVKDSFNCEYRGKIPAKGKGEIDMYFVISEKRPSGIPSRPEV